MEQLVTTASLAGLYLVVSSSVYRLSSRWNLKRNPEGTALSLSGAALALGFCITFTLVGFGNIIGHLNGRTVNFNIITALAAIAASFISRKQIVLLAGSTRDRLNKSIKSLCMAVKEKDAVVMLLMCIVALQAACLAYRGLLAVTHGDALSQYFYDSLQISRMSSLSLNDFYELGQGFRSDSLASFFDALIIQSSDSWLIARIARGIALILILILSHDLACWLGSRSTRAHLLMSCLILTLPDVWDIGLSGKHDVYVWLFELTGASLIVLALRSKESPQCTLFIASAVGVGITSTSIRLSSLSFTIAALTTLATSLGSLLYKGLNWKHKIVVSTIRPILAGGVLLLPAVIIAVFNVTYKGNPFYILSPPGEILNNIFPDAAYKYNYTDFVGAYSLRNIPSFLRTIASFAYGSLGLEPVRYALNTFTRAAQLVSPIAVPAKWLLNHIGPKDLMVSMLSLSPVGLIFFTSPKLLCFRHKLFVLFIIIWLIAWGSGITYTRVIVPASIVTMAATVSFLDANGKLNPITLARTNLISAASYFYGIALIALFSLWSLSTLADLPGGQIFSSRESQVRAYIELKNRILSINDGVPSMQFEHEWQNVMRRSKSSAQIPVLIKAAPQFAYFMNGGLIMENISISKNSRSISNIICYEMIENQNIRPHDCAHPASADILTAD